MSILERIIERVNRNGDFYAEGTPIPLLTLEEFFNGNDVVGSIGCNLDGAPHPSVIEKVLLEIRDRPDVYNIYVQITEMDDPDWPFSDTVWVITKVDESTISEYFPKILAPNEIWEGWQNGLTYEQVEVPSGFKVIACWWD